MSEESTQTSNEVVTKEVETPTPAPVVETPKPVVEQVLKDDINKTVLEAIAGIQTSINDNAHQVTKKFEEIDEKFKALEKPTDLPLKPKGTEGGDDIGAKVKVPDTYQSNSIQAGIREASPGNDNSNDKGGLKMQEKAVTTPETTEKTEEIVTKAENTFTTETPRGGFTVESVQSEILKAAQDDYCPVLKMAREVGPDRLSSDLATAIKRGDFYQPTQQELEDQITW